MASTPSLDFTFLITIDMLSTDFSLEKFEFLKK